MLREICLLRHRSKLAKPTEPSIVHKNVNRNPLPPQLVEEKLRSR